MADTRVQIEVEDWVRRVWMPEKYGHHFFRERVKLAPGGVFDFDVVSEDRKIVAAISTSSSVTAGGKHGVGKLMKIRSDMYFLLLADVERRIVVLTEKDMYERCVKEVEGGRVPASIEFIHAQIPEELQRRLCTSRGVASSEVTPNRHGKRK